MGQGVLPYSLFPDVTQQSSVSNTHISKNMGVKEMHYTPSTLIPSLPSALLPCFESQAIFMLILTQIGCAQANEDLLGKIAAAVGAAREQPVAPDVTVSTANAVIQRVAAALAVAPSIATPPTSSNPTGDEHEEAEDEGLRNRVFTAALQSLTEGPNADALTTQSGGSHGVANPNRNGANVTKISHMAAGGDNSDKALIAQRMFAAIQQGSQAPAPESLLTRGARDDMGSEPQTTVTVQGLLRTVRSPESEDLQGALGSSLLAALGPAIEAELAAAPAPAPLEYVSDGISEAAAPTPSVPEQAEGGVAKVIVSLPKEKSVGKAPGVSHKAKADGNQVQSFLQDGALDVPGGAGQNPNLFG